ncbi:MAG TPA: G8 domain-containing protein [Candidatus Elarobacter sp.]
MYRPKRRAPFVLACALVAASGWFALRSAAADPPARWSDAATWGGALPHAGDTVHVRAGRTVLLDVDPPPLAKLVIEGRLVFAERDAVLRTGAIDVRGTLAVGSAYHPFSHRAEIVLDGAAPGEGVVAVSGGGSLELYGTPRLSWTRLAETAAAGSRELTLTSAPGWSAGDRLAVAPTGFDAREAEEVVVVRVDGAHVTLAAPLRFAHCGAVTDGVDERAEVGLLSHNVRVRGEAAAGARGLGGQVVVMRGGRLRASNAEFAQLGRRGRLGAYPIHFHLAGDGGGSFVTGSSIHHAHNRCVTIHGTRDVRVTNDVAYDTIGHCYFLEDGGETGNVLDGNLGMLTRAAAPGEAVLDSDRQPATFWIANPDNVVTRNAAAGSDGSGFWYNLTPHPTGSSATASLWPRRTNLRAFADNVAHANEMNGLFVDNLRNPPGVIEAPNYSPAAVADYRRLVAYKNRRRGAWLRGTNLRLTGARIADNSIGVTFAGAGAVLRDSVVVGESENRTGPPKPNDPAFPIRGFEFYDGQVGVENTRFIGFVPDERRAAGALGALQYSPFFTDPTNYARGLTFENAQRVYLKPYAIAPTNDRNGADGYRSNVFRDLDGSVTGRAGTAVVMASPFLAGDDCVLQPDSNAAVCDAPYGSLFVSDLDARPRRMGPVRVARLGDGGAAGSSGAGDGEMLLLGNPRDGVNTSFQTNLRAGGRYGVRFGGAFPRRLRLSLHHLSAGQRITVLLPQAPRDAVAFAGRDARARVAALRDEAGDLVLELVTDAQDAGAVYDVCADAACR